VWTLDNYVEWLRTHVGSGPVILIGHSNGGRIALAFTAKYPDVVGRLILLDSSGIASKGLKVVKREVFRIVAKIGRMLVNSERLRTLLYKLARVADYRKATPEMQQTMANLLSVDLSLVLHTIPCPTLLIWGAQDTTTPLSDGKILHAGINGSRMIVIEGARHSPHITHTGKVIEILTDELKAV
jgi:pimeloyl-ACP methyl ester carboxylesterase